MRDDFALLSVGALLVALVARHTSEHMVRLLSITLASALLVTAGAQAQTAPAQQQPPQKPRAGTIIENPSAGRITESPTANPKTTPGNVPQAGDKIERFEAVGNTSVASDTIRVYLGVSPGDPYNPDALQKNSSTSGRPASSTTSALRRIGATKAS
jgi:hypothetical protein